MRKASKESCRAFCNSINNLPTSIRLHSALSRDSKIRLGSLVTSLVLRTHSEGETLELLLATNFPDSIVTEEAVAPAAQSDATGGWLRRLSPIGEWNGQLIPFPHTQVREWHIPGPATAGTEIVIPYLVRIFRACLSMGYVPAIWR